MNKTQLKKLIKETLQEEAGKTAGKFSIGNSVQFGTNKLQITKIDSFGSTQHYGFFGQTKDNKNFSGWIPVILLDSVGKLVS